MESTELLIMKANRLLYEMTSCNLERIRKQLLSLKIDTEEKLVKFVELVHSRAIDESNHIAQYAELCSKLAIAINNDKQLISFFTLFTEKCKEKFIEIGRYDDLINIEKRSEEKRIIQKRWLGNVKLIGALYMSEMVNTTLINRCVDKLIVNNDEDSFECLCELLRIIGWKYEANTKDKAKFDQLMNTLKEIGEENEFPRIGQMIQQVLELREGKWRLLQDLNSSTTGEADEQLSQLNEKENELLKQNYVGASNFKDISKSLPEHEFERKVNEILKISKVSNPQNHKKLAKQLIDLNIDTSSKLEKMIQLIFGKVYGKALKCLSLYADLLNSIYSDMKGQAKVNQHQNTRLVEFRILLFETSKSLFTSADRVRKDLNDIEQVDGSAKGKSIEEYLIRRDKEHSIVILAGELYMRDLLNSKDIAYFIDQQIEIDDEIAYEHLCDLLGLIGKRYGANQKDKAKFNEQVNGLRKVLDKKTISDDVKANIKKLFEIHQYVWKLKINGVRF